jgi:hypothetical protein
MIKKVTALAGAVACSGLVVMFVPAFPREIARAAVVLSTQTSITDRVFGPSEPICSQAPWPYGCDWRAPIVRKRVARKGHARHHRYARIEEHNNRFTTGEIFVVTRSTQQ